MFEIYIGEDDQWYWRLVDGNYKTVATGAEGYTRRRDVLRAIANVADLVVHDDTQVYDADRETRQSLLAVVTQFYPD